MNSRSKITLITIINTLAIGVLAFTWVFIKTPSQTLAATQPYTSTWTITKCMVASGFGNIAAGPAEWTVVHTLANGKKITEVWTATDFHKDNWRLSDDKIKWQVQSANTANGNCSKSNDGGAKRVSGLYGIIVGDSASGDNISFTSATPKGWVVTTSVQ